MLIVTAATPDYYPGVYALWNSIQRNDPNHELIVLAYGDIPDQFAERGIKAVPGPAVGCERLPAGRHENNDAMYIRLQLPQMFDADRLLWLDCDQIVLQPLTELETIDLEGNPCAMVDTHLTLRYQLKEVQNFQSDKKAGFAGLILYDRAAWIEQQVTERAFEIMRARTDLIFSFVVQSVLNFTLQGDFKALPDCYQRFGNRDIKKDAKVLHWHGRGANPWSTEREVVNSAIWAEYA